VDRKCGCSLLIIGTTYRGRSALEIVRSASTMGVDCAKILLEGIENDNVNFKNYENRLVSVLSTLKTFN